MRDEQLTSVSFYIAAHADDWQLFMQPNAYTDIVAQGNKVVFVITTAGDAGMGEVFWRAREEGMKSSVRFCVRPFDALNEAIGMRVINDHQINGWYANNVTAYFLRLPDGNLNGSGFAANNYQSLSRFNSGVIDCITAVDNSTNYCGWADFYTTLQAIIQHESRDISNVCLHYLNPDSNLNPGDHTDHIVTGKAVQEMAVISSLKQILYVGYSVGDKNIGLPASDLFWKIGMFAAYEKAVCDLSGYSTLQEGVSTYQKWCLSTAHFVKINY